MLEARLVSYRRIEERIAQMEKEFPRHNFQRYRDRLSEYKEIPQNKAMTSIFGAHR